MGCLHSKPAAAELPPEPVKPPVVPAKQEVAAKSVPQDQEEPADDGEQSSQLMVVLSELLVLPEDEDVRWDALASYNILDTEPEESYERITKLCKSLFKVPIAMITFVDKERVWLKSVQGLSGLTEVDRRYSICAWALLSRHPEALVVSDLREDIRFKDYPVVTGWPHVRSYAAAPLLSPGGQRLGTLCILDYKPRVFTAENAQLLAQLSGMVMREVERKKQMNDVLCNAALKTTGEAVATDRQGLMLLDASSPKWQILMVNDSWQRATGISSSLAAGANFWDLFEPPPMAQLQACKLAVDQRRNFELRVPCARNPRITLRSGPASLAGTLGGSVDGGTGTATGSTTGSAGDESAPPSVAHSAAGFSGPHSGPYSGAQSGAHSGAAQPQPPRGSLAGSDIGGGRYMTLPPGSAQLPPPAGAQRWVCMQFRSASSQAALSMAPAISIPPTLVTQPDKQNHYWVTVEETVSLAPAGDAGTVSSPPWSTGSPSEYERGVSGSFADGGGGVGCQGAYAISSSGTGACGGGAAFGGGGGGGGAAFGGGGGPSDAGSEPATPQRVTTFNLLPEENPFQDITIGSLLGWGSFGRVHRGYWNGTLVAIKILEQIAGDFNPRTALEPLLHHRLSHPNIVKMYDISTQEVDVCEDGRPLQEVWMVLEYCSRGTLGDAVSRGALCLPPGSPEAAAAAAAGLGAAGRGVPDVPRIVRLARDVASAMAYLHSEKVLHGDLNGNNILLVSPPDDYAGPASDLIPKVADFGLSRLLPLDSDRIVTRTHGTITHMAPEVITESLHSKAADVYSFGVVLWELLSLSKPYSGMHYAQIVHAIAESRGLDVPAAAPAALRQLLQRCIAPRPQERPSFQEVVDELNALEAAGYGQPAQPAPQAAAPAAAPAPPAGQQQGAAAEDPLPANVGGDGCVDCTNELMRQAAGNPPPGPNGA